MTSTQQSFAIIDGFQVTSKLIKRNYLVSHKAHKAYKAYRLFSN